MASPNVLFNNLVKENDMYIDPISKAYFIGDLVLGINRLFLFSKVKKLFIILYSAYSLFLCATVFYTTFIIDWESVYIVGLATECVLYIFNAVLSILVRKRLENYYQKLQEFDAMIGCRPKRTVASVKNIIQMCIVATLFSTILAYDWIVYHGIGLFQHVVYSPVRLFQVLEIHYFGHLLSLLVPRLRLINYYMKVSLSDHKIDAAPKVEELSLKSVTVSQNCQMKKLMDLYCVMISAYDVLIDAVKWQFLTMLTSLFISILSFSYIAALMAIRGTRAFINVVTEFGFFALRLLPLFAPCVFADQIHEEVRRLRELVASRLYEDKLNKPGRSVARALLALTEARDLSFSLLQIFDIDISLPFKFLGLLLTYLIILLQFEKVINP